MFNTLDIIITVAVVIIMLVPGFVLAKLKLVKPEALPALSAVLLYICQPFSSFKIFVLSTLEDRIALIPNMAIMFLISFVSLIIAFLLAKLAFCKQKNEDNTKILVFASTFGNCAFIGIPVISGITNSDPVALIYAAIFIVAFNVLLWTLGVFIITGNAKNIKFYKAVLNPPTVAFLLALPFFFIQKINIFNMHSSIEQFISFTGNMTTPLSMIIVGVRLAYIPFKKTFTFYRGYFMVALKQVVIPLVCFGLLYPFAHFNVFAGAGAEYIIPVVIVLSALPTAASTIAFCERFGGENAALYADTASKSFLQSTLSALITLPTVLLILNLL